MENTDSYPVFHSRLLRTQRRRLTRVDGTCAGWLIVNAADQFVDVGESASLRTVVPAQRHPA